MVLEGSRRTRSPIGFPAHVGSGRGRRETDARAVPRRRPRATRRAPGRRTTVRAAVDLPRARRQASRSSDERQPTCCVRRDDTLHRAHAEDRRGSGSVRFRDLLGPRLVAVSEDRDRRSDERRDVRACGKRRRRSERRVGTRGSSRSRPQAQAAQWRPVRVLRDRRRPDRARPGEPLRLEQSDRQ